MTQEEKDLLLKDLCGRLPYGVWIERKLKSCKFGAKCMLNAFDIYAIGKGQYDFYKPYLFPLSSMTEEQKREYNRWKHEVPVCHYEYGDVVEEVELFDSPESFEYLIENHFDYHGLIPMGLAIDATGLNIY